MVIERILNWLFCRQDIGRGDKGGMYLTRWHLVSKSSFLRRWLRIYLHWFHRSDADTIHDHPWFYVSIILAGGYWERTARGRRWYGPGRILVRPATWAHRVEVPSPDKTWSLVIAGPKIREWGFFCAGGWRHWLDAEAALGRHGSVCAEI